MKARALEPIRDKDGVLHPELDHRDVGLSTMAAYLGCSAPTLWRRVRDGVYRHGIVKVGNQNLFRPALFVARVRRRA